MALDLTGDEFEMIKKAFNILDENGSKYISRSELKKGFSDLSEDMVDFYLRLLDVDGDELISFTDFLEMYAFFILKKQPSATQMKQVFRALDKDKGGSISVNEVKLFCKMFAPADADDSQVDELIQAMDMDGDGETNYIEFVENYCKLEKSKFFMS